MMSCLARFRSAPALVLNTTIAAWLDKRSRTRWNRPARRWAVICIPLWAACGDNGGITPPPPVVPEYDLTGPWVGSLPPDGFEVRLNLFDRGGTIEGAGAIFIGERIVTMQVVGGVVASSGRVILNFYPSPPNRILFTGNMTSDSTMTGTLTESGYGGEEMTIRRWQGTPAMGAARPTRQAL